MAQFPVEQEMKVPQSWKETYLIILNKLNIILLLPFIYFPLSLSLALFRSLSHVHTT